jgi:hypothetical protein
MANRRRRRKSGNVQAAMSLKDRYEMAIKNGRELDNEWWDIPEDAADITVSFLKQMSPLVGF